jgi:hypothetical protein
VILWPFWGPLLLNIIVGNCYPQQWMERGREGGIQEVVAVLVMEKDGVGGKGKIRLKLGVASDKKVG